MAEQTDLHCTKYSPETGGWLEEPYQLGRARYHHTSWALASGEVVLLGGSVSPNTTEIVSPGENSRPAFSLSHTTLYVMIRSPSFSCSPGMFQLLLQYC